MKLSAPFLFAACGLLLATVGCSHLDIAGEGDANRVFTGTVNARTSLVPPADAKLLIRITEPQDVARGSTTVSNGLVIGERGTQLTPERVLAEVPIAGPSELPVPFRVECRISDAMLRRGVNIEARLSWGGKLRFRTVQAQVVTLATAAEPLTVWVESVQ